MHWGNASPATLIGSREISANALIARPALAPVGGWTTATALNDVALLISGTVKHVCADHLISRVAPLEDSSLEFADIDQIVAALDQEDPAGMVEARQWAGSVLYDSPRESLRALRLAAGLSQAKFAREMNTNQSVISRWENGKADMRVSTIHRIAAVLKANVDEVWHAVCYCSPEDESCNA